MQQTTPSPDELSLPFGKADFISLNKMEMYVKHTLWIQFVAWGGESIDRAIIYWNDKQEYCPK